MALQPCRRCFSRLNVNSKPQPSTRSVTAPAFDAPRLFSSSAPAFRDGKSKTLNLKRNQRAKTQKVPAVGERKAVRKRIVLSNTNALPIDDLKEWDRRSISSQELLGQVVALKDESVDSLRALESFRPGQGWGLFNRPSTLLRRETMDLVRALDDAGSDSVRRLIVGAHGSGKTVLLLQAHATALMKGWVVIHMPEAQHIVDASTAYAPLSGTSPIRYSQPVFTAALLGHIVKANEKVLSKLNMQLEHADPVAGLSQPHMSLLQLAEIGAHDSDVAWPVFEALWAELTIPNSDIAKAAPHTAASNESEPQTNSGKKGKQPPQPPSGDQTRPPVMVTLDNIAAVSRQSAYLNPEMHHLHGYDLSIIDLFISYLSGAKQLPNGGAFLAADTASYRPSAPSVDLAVEQSEERAAAGGDGVPEQPLFDPRKPYERRDDRVLRALRQVPVLRLRGVARDEARSVLEYYARSGMLRAKVTDALVSEKWALSGGGLIGELEKSSVRAGYM